MQRLQRSCENIHTKISFLKKEAFSYFSPISLQRTSRNQMQRLAVRLFLCLPAPAFKKSDGMYAAASAFLLKKPWGTRRHMCLVREAQFN
jgi:hypothetical protein